MKKRDLKKRILNAYKAETPDLRSDILAACEKEPQVPRTAEGGSYTARHPSFNAAFKWVAAAVSCLMLFISGLSVGVLIPDEDRTVKAESFVYLDVNPSIELRMDGDNNIVECIPANDDARVIIADMRLEGVDMNTALRAIIGSMYVNGYLTAESNSILVSVDAGGAGADGLLTDITDKVNDIFANSGLECSIIAQSVTVSEELKQRALENGVSVGKMYLVEKMVEGIDGYGQEDASELSNMSIKDLNLIYSTRPDREGRDDPFEKDKSYGEIGGVINKDDALEMLLLAVGIDADEVEDYEIKADVAREEDSHRMVYVLRLRLLGDETVYEFKIGCDNGDIVEVDDRIPSRSDMDEDREQDDGHREDDGFRHNENIGK